MTERRYTLPEVDLNQPRSFTPWPKKPTQQEIEYGVRVFSRMPPHYKNIEEYLDAIRDLGFCEEDVERYRRIFLKIEKTEKNAS